MIFERPVDVVSHVNVGVAIAVEISKRGTAAPLGIRQSRFLRGLFERTVAHVVVELQASVTRHEKIQKPVIVKVRDGDSVRIETRCVDRRRRTLI